jgi:hypothetical protein
MFTHETPIVWVITFPSHIGVGMYGEVDGVGVATARYSRKELKCGRVDYGVGGPYNTQMTLQVPRPT